MCLVPSSGEYLESAIGPERGVIFFIKPNRAKICVIFLLMLLTALYFFDCVDAEIRPLLCLIVHDFFFSA